MIKSGVLQITDKEFGESKVFSSEEKSLLKDIEVSEEVCKELKERFNDFVENRSELNKVFRKKEEIDNC